MSKPLADTIDTTLYLERWIAVVRERVIGVGATANQAYRAAKQIRPKDKPDLYFVAADGSLQEQAAALADQAQPAWQPQAWLDRQPLLRQTVNILRAQEIEAYLVGGAVRDFLLGRENIVDLDFAVPGDGLAAARRVADALGAAFYPLDAARGTGRAVISDEPDANARHTYLDFAAFRGDDLLADLRDRDFTINAIALSLDEQPRVIDPLGGQQDLVDKVVRMASPDAFRNDPVRLLRAVRQAVDFDFALDPDTGAAMQQAVPLLERVSAERQRDELLKLLNTAAPGQAVEMLHRRAILPSLLPEVEALVGVTQSAPHHLDVFDHTLAALRQWATMAQAGWPDAPDARRADVDTYMNEMLAGKLSLRTLMPLALLLHDTGKPATRTETDEEGATRVRFLGHEQESAGIARQVLHRFRLSGQASQFVISVISHHMRPLLLANEPSVSRRALYRFFRDTGGPGYRAGVAVALHALADHRATYPPGEGLAEEAQLLPVCHRIITTYFEQREQVVDPPPLLTGRDLIDELGIPPGSVIGVLLRRLKEAQAAGQVTTRAEAVAFVEEQAEAL